MWAVNLLRDLPARLARVAVTVWAALWGLVTWLPHGGRAWRAGGATDFRRWARASLRRGGGRLFSLVMQLLDLIGAPELVGLVLRAVTRATPLTGAEIAAAAAVLGPTGLRYGDVRIAEGGLLRLVFKLNGGRAFTTFHTVNLPNRGGHQRSAVDILVHELVHVYQHECVGGVYIGECVYAQATTGYDYGGPENSRRRSSRITSCGCGMARISRPMSRSSPRCAIGKSEGLGEHSQRWHIQHGRCRRGRSCALGDQIVASNRANVPTCTSSTPC
ncbi:MAG: hypothetical protein CVU38_12755 [Chloroflexi bacterium HGW-Chloroflexi-1]|nr:MAG: hypothetical protein CVU38_12755 [Chloroflexi bacterium HGW-Chloroflexi-1]